LTSFEPEWFGSMSLPIMNMMLFLLEGLFSAIVYAQQ